MLPMATCTPEELPLPVDGNHDPDAMRALTVAQLTPRNYRCMLTVRLPTYQKRSDLPYREEEGSFHDTGKTGSRIQSRFGDVEIKRGWPQAGTYRKALGA